MDPYIDELLKEVKPEKARDAGAARESTDPYFQVGERLPFYLKTAQNIPILPLRKRAQVPSGEKRVPGGNAYRRERGERADCQIEKEILGGLRSLKSDEGPAKAPVRSGPEG